MIELSRRERSKQMQRDARDALTGGRRRCRRIRVSCILFLLSTLSLSSQVRWALVASCATCIPLEKIARRQIHGRSRHLSARLATIITHTHLYTMTAVAMDRANVTVKAQRQKPPVSAPLKLYFGSLCKCFTIVIKVDD